MESNDIVLWSILVLATLSLIAYYKIRNRNKEKKIFSELKYFAQENDCLITSYDHWDKSLIGISTGEHNKLFFIRKVHNIEYREIIDLTDVNRCQLVKEESHINVNKEKVNIINKIGLVFSFLSKNKPDVKLEFYNNEYDQLTIWAELELAKKWTEIVKNVISTNQLRVREVKKVNNQARLVKNEHYGHGQAAFNPSKGKRKSVVHEY